MNFILKLERGWGQWIRLCRSTHVIVYLLSKYLLSNCWVPDTGLGKVDGLTSVWVALMRQRWYSLHLLLSHFSHVRLCVTPQTAAHQAPRPWDSPGKNTGVGCHFLLQCMKGKRESEVAQSCLTLSDPMDQAPPAMGFSRQEYWSGVPIPGATESEFLPQPPFF